MALSAHKAGRLDEAEARYRDIARRWRPDWTFGNLAALLRITGRLAEAEEAARESLEHNPSAPFVRHTLGMILLQRGNYAEGWCFYEARREFLKRPTPAASIPEWQGETLVGKRVLVVTEEGFGDQILFARFLPALARVAAEVHYAATRATVRLFSDLPVNVFHPDTWEEVQADVWISLGSVATYLGATPDAEAASYLSAPAENVSGRIGLMLTGAPGNPNHALRTPPAEVAQDIRALAEFVDLDPANSGTRDFQETAQIIAGLEGVVTVDTSIAHLAGALGKPVWIIAPRPAIDWYTRWDSELTPWYPSANVIRQRTPGDWSGVLEELRHRL